MKKILIITLSLAALSLTACHKDSAHNLVDKTPEKYNQFKKEMDQKIAVLDQKIEKLKKSAQDKTAATKDGFNAKINNLEDVREDLDERINKIKDASKDSYVDLKVGIENSYNKLESEVEKAFN